MTKISRALLSRFYHDWTELVESPYPGVTVFTDEADIRKFCLVLTPPSGPWKDLALHFDVELPDTWVSPSTLFSFGKNSTRGHHVAYVASPN
jgi:hypothetical protein